MFLGPSFTALLVRLLLGFYGYKTYETVQSDRWRMDNNWLLFWLIYAIFQLVEFFADFILGWLPLYYEAKLGAFVYLGMFGGAAKAYELVGKNLMQKVQVQYAKVQQSPQFQQAYGQVNTMLQKKTGYTLPATTTTTQPSFSSALNQATTNIGNYMNSTPGTSTSYGGSYPSGYTPSPYGRY